MSKTRDPSTVVSSAGAGAGADVGRNSLVPPIFVSDTYRWADSDTKPEYDYSRTVNPNRDIVAGALAELEGAAGGVVTGSGQSAALLALLLLPAGAHVVAPHDCYGGTYRLIQGFADQGRLTAAFIDMADDDGFDGAMRNGPALVWIESPSNPLLRLTDIADRAARAKAAGALAIADNTLPTPCRQRPLALGCDLVLHSTTKALNGHADLFGGALLTGDPALLEKMIWWANAAGLSGSAHDSAQILRGLRTLPLRIDRMEASAVAVADWLASHEQALVTHYPGLAGHPDFDLASRQQSGPGFMIAFRVAGGEAATGRFLAAIELITLASSLGGFATLVCKPSTMTHRGMPPEVQAEAGIAPDLLRLSIGLEDSADLIADLERGFAAAA